MTAQPLLVAITGGTGSGKSTLATAIANQLGRSRVSILPQDAYYRDRSDLPPETRATLNYDVPEAIDNSLFYQQLFALRSGQPIQMPVYSFQSHTRTGQTCPVDPRDVILVEGLLVLFDPGVRGLFHLKVFMDAPERVRMQRRMRRDVLERGRTATSILMQFHDTVMPAHRKYIDPTKAFADLVLLNTGPMEACVDLARKAIMDRLDLRGGKAGSLQQAANS